MRVSVAVIMAMVMMTERSHTDQVDQQTHGTNNEQLSQSFGFPALHHSLNRLEHDLHADQNQKHAVGEAAQCLDLAEAVRKSFAGRPFASNSCEQANCQGNAVEEHVYTVAQKTERICDVAVKRLYSHEGEVYPVKRGLAGGNQVRAAKQRVSLRHEVENTPRVLLRHDRMDQRVFRGIWEQERSESRPLSPMVVV